MKLLAAFKETLNRFWNEEPQDEEQPPVTAQAPVKGVLIISFATRKPINL